MPKPKGVARLVQPRHPLRNNIYMAEKAKRDGKAERRQRQTEAEIAKRRRHDQFIASQNYRKSVDYIQNVLGWNNG